MGLVTESRMEKGNTMRNFQKKKIEEKESKEQIKCSQIHCKENPIYVFLSGNCTAQFPHSCVCEQFIYVLPGSVHIFPCSRLGRLILEIYKSLTDIECRNWETEHYNSVLEITVSSLGIHK